MSIEKLSNEVLHEIAVCLGNLHRGKVALSQLALCSRHLNIITTPILYQTVNQSGEQALPALLKAILAKPELGNHITTYNAAIVDEDAELDMSAYTDEDFTRCQSAMTISHISEHDSEALMTSVRTGQWQALTAFLLLSVPNLEVLNMTAYHDIYEYPGYGVASALQRVARLQQNGDISGPSLQKLKTVSVTYYDTENGLSYSDINPFLAIPSVKHFKVFKFSQEDEYSGHLPTKSHAETLEIQYSALHPGFLTDFLRCFPNLKELSYEHAGGIIGCNEFLPQNLGSGIHHLKPCLEMLSASGAAEGDDDDDPMAIGSLADFEKLTSIDMWEGILLGPERGTGRIRLAEILPTSLTELKLQQCVWSCLDALEDFLAHAAQSTPLLKIIVIDFGMEWMGAPHHTDAADAARLVEEFDAIGIKLTLHPSPSNFTAGGRGVSS